MIKKNEDRNIKINIVLISIIITIFITIPFILNLAPPQGVYYDNKNPLYHSILCIFESLQEFDLKWSLYFFFIFYFIYNTYKEKIETKKNINGVVLSIILTYITMMGKALKSNNTLTILYTPNYQLFKTIILSIGYFFIYYSLYRKVISTKIILPKKKEKNKIIAFFDEHQTLISVIAIIIAWLPIIIIYYPGVASGDTLDSLAQFFNKREYCWSAKAIILKNNDVILNKHHSVLFTLLFGLIVKIGNNMMSYSFGMFLFIIIQTIILIISFTFLLYYMKKINIPTWIRILSLLYICFCPLISDYTIAAIKDTLGAILILIYNIFLLQIIRNYKSIIKNKIYIIVFMITILLTFMIKNNSMFIIITSYTSLILYFLYLKEFNKAKKLTLIILLPLIIFLSYDRILLPSLDVTGTNKKESYSIPFMQIARLASRNDDAISQTDKEIINKVLNYNAIKRDYTPKLADSVKNTYKKEVTDYELKQFWKVYFKYMKKYPKLYIAAVINSTYGYYFPEIGETRGIEKADGRLNNEIFKIKNLDKFQSNRKIKEKIGEIFEIIPFFSFFNHIAYYTWFLIFSIAYILKNKNYKYIIPIISLITILLSSLISPIYGSFRYILAIVFCIPLIATIDYLVLIEKSNKK